MGLLIHDNIDPGIGIQLVDTYASFHNQEVRIQPVEDPTCGKYYNLSSRYVIFASKKACDNNLKPLAILAIRTRTDNDGIKDVYSTLYSELAKKYQHVDSC